MKKLIEFKALYVFIVISVIGFITAVCLYIINISISRDGINFIICIGIIIFFSTLLKIGQKDAKKDLLASYGVKKEEINAIIRRMSPEEISYYKSLGYDKFDIAIVKKNISIK